MSKAIPFWQVAINQEFKEHPTSVVVFKKLAGYQYSAVVVRPGRQAYRYFEADVVVYVDESGGEEHGAI